jgi:hypothetical protein
VATFPDHAVARDQVPHRARWLVRFPVFCKMFWMAACARSLSIRLRVKWSTELVQAVFKHFLLRHQELGKLRIDLFVQRPQLVDGHQFQGLLLHDRSES